MPERYIQGSGVLQVCRDHLWDGSVNRIRNPGGNGENQKIHNLNYLHHHQGTTKPAQDAPQEPDQLHIETVIFIPTLTSTHFQSPWLIIMHTNILTQIVCLAAIAAQAFAAAATTSNVEPANAAPSNVVPAPLNTNPLAASLLGTVHHSPTPKSIKVLKSAGFTWIRNDVSWAEVETVQGQYNYDHIQSYFQAIQDNAMGLISIFSSSNPLYDQGKSCTSTACITANKNYAVGLAKHFQEVQVLWELYNEPNTGKCVTFIPRNAFWVC